MITELGEQKMVNGVVSRTVKKCPAAYVRQETTSLNMTIDAMEGALQVAASLDFDVRPLPERCNQSVSIDIMIKGEKLQIVWGLVFSRSLHTTAVPY